MLVPEDDAASYETTTINDTLGSFMAIPYKDGTCIYLDGDSNMCRIYDRRPNLCREFNCLDGYKCRADGGHSFFLNDNEKVVRLIENLGLIRR